MTDKKLKPVIEYYDDGKIRRAYSVNEKRQYNGPYERYLSNGQLAEKCTYKDGKLDGPYEEYHKNGQLEIKCTYKNGKRFDPEEAKKARKGLNARLAQMDKQMAPTQLRQSIKRAEVAKFRAKFPNKKDGR